MDPVEINEVVERLKSGNVFLSSEQLTEYIEQEESLGEVEKGATVPIGYKRCGKCGEAKKFGAFNKNKESKTNTTGNCKQCQRNSASSSYKKTKQRRNYKKYYAANKEMKQEHAKKYYRDNKDKVTAKHKEYLQTKKGKQTMSKAHGKRRASLDANRGVPYTRALVIDRDSVFQSLPYPVCYLCGKPITDISGVSLHLDHVIPVVMGGSDCFTNVASTHALCNLEREKDARALLPEQIERIKTLSAAYIEAFPEKFA